MMYYKMIGGRQVFSTCRAIRLENNYPELGLEAGQVVCNPSIELITSEGWLEYIPPVIPPIPTTEPEYEEVVSAIKRMFATQTEEMSDEEALEVAALFPTWISKMGKQVFANERLWYNEKLYRVIQDHTVQEDWTPDVAASLYTEISIIEWPEWVQPQGQHDAYMTDDKVTHNNIHWQSNIDYNVYEPGVYGWREA